MLNNSFNQTLTQEQAEVMRERAVKKALDLDITGMLLFLLKNDATTIEKISDKQGNTIAKTLSRPLRGSGFVLHGHRTEMNGWDKFWISSADNYTDIVFKTEIDHKTIYVKVFRDGAWVHSLNGEVKAVQWRLENKKVIDIVSRYAPLSEQGQEYGK
jgi:hypothetical protein